MCLSECFCFHLWTLVTATTYSMPSASMIYLSGITMPSVSRIYLSGIWEVLVIIKLLTSADRHKPILPYPGRCAVAKKDSPWQSSNRSGGTWIWNTGKIEGRIWGKNTGVAESWCITCILSPSYLQCLLFEVQSTRDEMVIIQQEQLVHSGRSLLQLLPFIKQLRALVKHDLVSDE